MKPSFRGAPTWKRHPVCSPSPDRNAQPAAHGSLITSTQRMLFTQDPASPGSCNFRQRVKQSDRNAATRLKRDSTPCPTQYVPNPVHIRSSKTTAFSQVGATPEVIPCIDPTQQTSPALIAHQRSVAAGKVSTDGRTDRTHVHNAWSWRRDAACEEYCGVASSWIRQDRATASGSKYNKQKPASTSTSFLASERPVEATCSVDAIYNLGRGPDAACTATCSGQGRDKLAGESTEDSRAPHLSAVTYRWGEAKDKLKANIHNPPKLDKFCSREQCVPPTAFLGPAQWFEERYRTAAPDMHYPASKAARVKGCVPLPEQRRPTTADRRREKRKMRKARPGDKLDLNPKAVRKFGELRTSPVLGAPKIVPQFDRMLGRDNVAGAPAAAEYKPRELPPEALVRHSAYSLSRLDAVTPF